MLFLFSDWLTGISRGGKRLLQVFTDALLIALNYFIAMTLHHGNLAFLSDRGFWIPLLVVIPVSLGVFIKLGFYRAILRYITSRAYMTMLTGVIASTIMLVLAGLATAHVQPWPVPIIYGLLALVSIGGLRFVMRYILLIGLQRPRARVVIYGAGPAGRQLQNSLISSHEYVAVAFVDDNPNLQGRIIGGCTVHPPQRLREVLAKHGARDLLLAMPQVTRAHRIEILERIGDLPVHIQSIPAMADIVSGRTRISEIADVPVEDLLGRDPVPPRPELMGRDIRGRVVLVTGAGGSIGSELCRQIMAQKPAKLLLLDSSEYNLYAIDQELQSIAQAMQPPPEVLPVLGSVGNADLIATLLAEHVVETIYHAAAYKHVPMVERNFVEGITNNVFGTQILAEAAVKAGVKAFILISTDKAVRPTNIMGASKRMAELICLSLSEQQDRTRFSMVRFGNVLASSGSVIPLFHRQIEAGGPITVTHPEVTRYFMTIAEAAQLVIQAGAMSRGGDVFVLDMGEPVRIVDLACRMAQLSQLKPVIMPSVGDRRIEDGDIEIRFVGLRPGEKLHEELLMGSDAAPTDHPRIMTATEAALPSPLLVSILDRLRQHCQTRDLAAIRGLLLAEAVPEHPSTSQPEEQKRAKHPSPYLVASSIH